MANIKDKIENRRSKAEYKIKIVLGRYEFTKACEWAKEVTGKQSKKNCGMNYNYKEEYFKNVLGKMGETTVVYASIGEDVELRETEKLYTDIPSNKDSDFTYDFKNKYYKTIDVKTISNVFYNLCDNTNAIERKGNDIYILVRTIKDFSNINELELELKINGYIEFVIEGIAIKDELYNGEVKYSSDKEYELRIMQIEDLHEFKLIDTIGGEIND